MFALYNFIVRSSGNIFGIYVKTWREAICAFNLVEGGFTMIIIIIIIHLVYIYFFSIQYYKSQPIKARKSSLYKKQQQIHTDDPCHPKAPYCKSFHGTLFREYHRTRSTPTQTHRQWLGHMATLHTFSPGLRSENKKNKNKKQKRII